MHEMEAGDEENDVSASVDWDGICEPGDLIWTWDLTKEDLQDGLVEDIQ